MFATVTPLVTVNVVVEPSPVPVLLTLAATTFDAVIFLRAEALASNTKN
mgnify:CR=1 FL=1